MARDENQTQVWKLTAQRLPSLECKGLFRSLGTAGNEDQFIGLQSKELAQFARLGVRAIGLNSIEFDRARHVQSVAWRSQRQQAIGVFVILGSQQMEAIQQPSNQRADAAIASETLRTDSAVDECQWNTKSIRSQNEVRPEL